MNSFRLFVATSLTSIASVLAGCAVYPAYPIGSSLAGYAAVSPGYGQTSPLLVTPGVGYYGNPYDVYSGGYGGSYGGYPPSYYRPPGSYRYFYGDQYRRPYSEGSRNHIRPRTRSDAAPAAQLGNLGHRKGPGSHRDRD